MTMDIIGMYAGILFFVHSLVLPLSAQEYELRCLPFKGGSEKIMYRNTAGNGYDVWLSDQWGTNGDPGVKSKIFEINCKPNEGSTVGYYDFVQVTHDLNCRKDFSTETITTFSDYISKIDSNRDSSIGVGANSSFGYKGSGFGVNLKLSAKYSQSSHSEFSKTRSLFEKNMGEVLLTSAVCNTDDFKIGRYVRPKFTRNFIYGLMALNKTLSKSTASQDIEALRFIKQFGTHYAGQSDLGARMIHEKRFSNRSKTNKEAKERRRCSNNAASACSSVGATGKGVDVSFGSCVSSKEDKCSNNSFASNSGDTNVATTTKTVTIGTQLSSSEDWGRTDDFIPVVIGYVLLLNFYIVLTPRL